jgi:hypothetical protein
MVKKRQRTGEDDKRDVLLYLCEHGESTVTEMAEKLKINKGQISRAVHAHDLKPHLNIKIGSGGSHLISFVCDDPHTLWKVLAATGRDRRARRTVQNSQYVSGWYPKLAEAFLWNPLISELWTDLYDMYIDDPRRREKKKQIEKASSLVDSFVMNGSLKTPATHMKGSDLHDRINQLVKNPSLQDDDPESIDIVLQMTEERSNYYSDLFINDPSSLRELIPKITDDTVRVFEKANAAKSDLEAESKETVKKELDVFYRGLYENWLFLKFVVYFVAADDDEKDCIYGGLLVPIRRSSTAKFKDGYFKGLRDAHVNIWGLDGVYAERFEGGSPDTPLDYLIGLFKDMSRSFDDYLIGLFKDMSRSFDAFSYLFD